MSEKAKASEAAAAGIGAKAAAGEVVDAPYFAWDFACADSNGIKWTARIDHNSVVNQGRNLILNRLLASWTSYSNGALLFLHSASLATNNVWSQISASQVVSYGNSIPAITFSTQDTAASNTGSAPFMTATATYGFNASTQTVSGCGVLFYSSASGGTNLATADARLYCYGTFSNGSRQVQNGDTLTVTQTVSFA
jgi:hypothetical protein